MSASNSGASPTPVRTIELGDASAAGQPAGAAKPRQRPPAPRSGTPPKAFIHFQVALWGAMSASVWTLNPFWGARLVALCSLLFAAALALRRLISGNIGGSESDTSASPVPIEEIVWVHGVPLPRKELKPEEALQRIKAYDHRRQLLLWTALAGLAFLLAFGGKRAGLAIHPSWAVYLVLAASALWALHYRHFWLTIVISALLSAWGLTQAQEPSALAAGRAVLTVSLHFAAAFLLNRVQVEWEDRGQASPPMSRPPLTPLILRWVGAYMFLFIVINSLLPDQLPQWLRRANNPAAAQARKTSPVIAHAAREIARIQLRRSQSTQAASQQQQQQQQHGWQLPQQSEPQLTQHRAVEQAQARAQASPSQEPLPQDVIQNGHPLAENGGPGPDGALTQTPAMTESALRDLEAMLPKSASSADSGVVTSSGSGAESKIELGTGNGTGTGTGNDPEAGSGLTAALGADSGTGIQDSRGRTSSQVAPAQATHTNSSPAQDPSALTVPRPQATLGEAHLPVSSIAKNPAMPDLEKQSAKIQRELQFAAKVMRMALIMVAGYLVFHLLTSIRRTPKPEAAVKAALTAQEKRAVRARLEALRRSGLAPDEEVIATYNEILRMFELFELPRDESLPAETFVQEIGTRLPAIQIPLVSATEIFCRTLYGKKLLTPPLLEKYRSDVRGVLRFFQLA